MRCDVTINYYTQKKAEIKKIQFVNLAIFDRLRWL